MTKWLVAIFLGIYLSLLNLAYAVDSHAVVLMYHRFGEDRYPSTNISTESFIKQLDFIEEQNFQVWPLAKIVEHLKSKQPLPDKVVDNCRRRLPFCLSNSLSNLASAQYAVYGICFN